MENRDRVFNLIRQNIDCACVEVSRGGSLAVGCRAKQHQHQTAERYCNGLDFLVHDSSFFDFKSLIAAHASGQAALSG
jgi:hypothetical protein